MGVYKAQLLGHTPCTPSVQGRSPRYARQSSRTSGWESQRLGKAASSVPGAGVFVCGPAMQSILSDARSVYMRAPFPRGATEMHVAALDAAFIGRFRVGCAKAWTRPAF